MWNIDKNAALYILLDSNHIKQQEESFELIKEHGKEKAIKICQDYIDSEYAKINNMPFYDKDRIDGLERSIRYYEQVKYLCEHWINN